jgi:hypothetical protein
MAMVHDNSQDIIYFNGVRIKISKRSLDKTQHPLVLVGIRSTKADFDGAIDDVAIYNRA